MNITIHTIDHLKVVRIDREAGAQIVIDDGPAIAVIEVRNGIISVRSRQGQTLASVKIPKGTP